MCFRDILTCCYFNAKMIYFGPPVGGRLGAKMLPKSILTQVGRPCVAILALFWEVSFLFFFILFFSHRFGSKGFPKSEVGGTGAWLLVAWENATWAQKPS